MGTIIHSYTNTKNKLRTVITEVPAELYYQIRETTIEFISDIIIVKCTNSATCLKCSGQHLTQNCSNADIKCSDCDFSNKHYNIKYSILITWLHIAMNEILKVN